MAPIFIFFVRKTVIAEGFDAFSIFVFILFQNHKWRQKITWIKMAFLYLPIWCRFRGWEGQVGGGVVFICTSYGYMILHTLFFYKKPTAWRVGSTFLKKFQILGSKLA